GVVAPVLVVRSSTIWKPSFGSNSLAILRLSWQKRLSQVKTATVLRSFGPPCPGHSVRNEKRLATIVRSFGPVRQYHLYPFSVSVGDAHGWQDSGMPERSARARSARRAPRPGEHTQSHSGRRAVVASDPPLSRPILAQLGPSGWAKPVYARGDRRP